ncbi:hypothetical protein [Baekduia alba]|uniref:hypothetical protein n=1 Tax=Baekduia alba TaxID=2997333 RepID=UPI002340CB2C|nr:hypothetical protein [Baekduia alba]
MPRSPRSPLPRRAVALLATCSFAAGVGAAATDAHAATSPHGVRVCAAEVKLVESPGGAVVGVVHDGDVVRVLLRDRGDRWRRVLTRFRTRGWLRTSTICPEDR